MQNSTFNTQRFFNFIIDRVSIYQYDFFKSSCLIFTNFFKFIIIIKKYKTKL